MDDRQWRRLIVRCDLVRPRPSRDGALSWLEGEGGSRSDADEKIRSLFEVMHRAHWDEVGDELLESLRETATHAVVQSCQMAAFAGALHPRLGAASCAAGLALAPELCAMVARRLHGGCVPCEHDVNGALESAEAAAQLLPDEVVGAKLVERRWATARRVAHSGAPERRELHRKMYFRELELAEDVLERILLPDLLGLALSQDPRLLRLGETRRERQRQADSCKARGNELFQNGSCQDAEDYYTEALTFVPGDGILYANRAAAKLGRGKFEKALRDANECVRLCPSYAKGFYRKALCLQGLRRNAEAVQAVTLALELAPESAAMAKLLADLQLSADRAPDRLGGGSAMYHSRSDSDSDEEPSYVPLPHVVRQRVSQWTQELPAKGAVSLATAHWTQPTTSESSESDGSRESWEGECFCGVAMSCASSTERAYAHMLRSDPAGHANLSDPASPWFVHPVIAKVAWKPWEGIVPEMLIPRAAGGRGISSGL